MAIELSEYDAIFSRPGRTRGGDEGVALTGNDEAALDRAWSIVADEDGVEQLADQPTPAEIKDFS